MPPPDDGDKRGGVPVGGFWARQALRCTSRRPSRVDASGGQACIACESTCARSARPERDWDAGQQSHSARQPWSVPGFGWLPACEAAASQQGISNRAQAVHEGAPARRDRGHPAGRAVDRADRASFPLIGSVDQVADSTDPLAATGLPHRMRALYRVQPTAYGNGPRRLPVRTCRSPQTPVSVGWMLNP